MTAGQHGQNKDERFPAHPSGSESDSNTEKAAKDGWASEDRKEDSDEDSEGSPQG